MKRFRKVLIGLACALLITFFIVTNLYRFIPIHSSNNTPIGITERTKIQFSNGVPIGESCEFQYSSRSMGKSVTPAGIWIDNNSTHLVYDITIRFSIWLQADNGSLLVEKYSRKYYDSMPPFSSVYLNNNEIPTLSTQKYLYHIPPNCSYIKSTIDEVYGYV
jgi:hypothetical protein